MASARDTRLGISTQYFSKGSNKYLNSVTIDSYDDPDEESSPVTVSLQ